MAPRTKDAAPPGVAEVVTEAFELVPEVANARAPEQPLDADADHSNQINWRDNRPAHRQLFRARVISRFEAALKLIRVRLEKSEPERDRLAGVLRESTEHYEALDRGAGDAAAAAERAKDRLRDEYLRLVRHPKIRSVRVTPEKLVVKTAPLVATVKKTGVRYDCGRWRIEFPKGGRSAGSVRAYSMRAHQRSSPILGHMVHPHIFHNKSLCSGNMEVTITSAMASGDFDAAIVAIIGLLDSSMMWDSHDAYLRVLDETQDKLAPGKNPKDDYADEDDAPGVRGGAKPSAKRPVAHDTGFLGLFGDLQELGPAGFGKREAAEKKQDAPSASPAAAPAPEPAPEHDPNADAYVQWCAGRLKDLEKIAVDDFTSAKATLAQNASAVRAIEALAADREVAATAIETVAAALKEEAGKRYDTCVGRPDVARLEVTDYGLLIVTTPLSMRWRGATYKLGKVEIHAADDGSIRIFNQTHRAERDGVPYDHPLVRNGVPRFTGNIRAVAMQSLARHDPGALVDAIAAFITTVPETTFVPADAWPKEEKKDGQR